MNFSFIKIPRNPFTRTLFFIVADLLSIFLSFYVAFFVRFEGDIPLQYERLVAEIALLAIVFIVPIFYFNKLYSFSWSYVSSNELTSLFISNTIAFAFLSLAIYLSKNFYYFENFPRSTLFIAYILFFIFSGGIRFSKRVYLRFIGLKGGIKKEITLIVGAGDAAEQILRSIIAEQNVSYQPIGFVDDNKIKQGVLIHGLKVLGPISKIPEIVEKFQVERIIIAIPSAGSKTIKEAIDLASKAGIQKIKITPPLNEIINEKISFQILKDVDVADLLGRDAIGTDLKEIRVWLENKVVMVTGAGGSIGSELCRQIARFNVKSLVLIDQDETAIFNIKKELTDKHSAIKLTPLVMDINDQIKLKNIFSSLKPEIVFHAAAYKHVPLMEENPDEAVKNNILGTLALVNQAIENHIEKFIFISTDKAVNPVSVMGMSKRIGEMICQAYNQKNNTKFISVRFGNVLDSRGSVVPIFREQIKKGGPVEVTHPDMKRYFMLISEACLLVMQAGAMGNGGEVFVLDMGKPVKIVDLAKEMIRLSGFEPDKDIAIVYTGPRPGEKLFEEILTSEEGISVTENRKIFNAKLKTIDGVELFQRIKKLEQLLHSNNKQELVTVIKNIVTL